MTDIILFKNTVNPRYVEYIKGDKMKFKTDAS